MTKIITQTISIPLIRAFPTSFCLSSKSQILAYQTTKKNKTKLADLIMLSETSCLQSVGQVDSLTVSRFGHHAYSLLFGGRHWWQPISILPVLLTTIPLDHTSQSRILDRGSTAGGQTRKHRSTTRERKRKHGQANMRLTHQDKHLLLSRALTPDSSVILLQMIAMTSNTDCTLRLLIAKKGRRRSKETSKGKAGAN